MSYPTNVPVLLASTTLASAAASITFSSIPSTYRSLRLIFSGATTAAITWSNVGIRFNGDSGSNYYHQLTSTVFASSTTGAWAGASTGGGGVNASFSGNDIVVYDYASTNRRKLMVGLGVTDTSTTSTPSAGAGFYYNLWTGNAAITSITFLDFTGNNLATGTMASVYGFL